ncbi:MAG: DeoR family transcriptional regulator [Desulfuromonadales bacterium]
MRVLFRPHPAMDIDVDDTVNVPVNVPVNERQAWFLEQIVAEKKPKSIDVAEYFNVTTMTAKRDIADLKERGLIEFVGSAKTGWYRRK